MGADTPQPTARLELLARQMGRLLKSYAGDPGSATDFMGMLNAFAEGLSGPRQTMTHLQLPLLARHNHHISAGGYPDMNAAGVVEIMLGSDCVQVSKVHLFDPMRGKQPEVFVTLDGDERLSVSLRGSPIGEEHRILAEDRGELVP